MSHTAGPASPPQTPVTASPVCHHKPAHGPHGRHSHHLHQFARNTSSHHAIKPNPQHTKFPAPGGPGANSIPFRPNVFRPDDLSPRSSGSSPTMNNGDDSDDAENDADDDDDDDDDDEMDSGSDASSSVSPSPSRSSSKRWRAPGEAPRSAVPDAPGAPGAPDVLDVPAAPNAAADSPSSFVLYAEENLVIEEISDFDSDGGRVLVLLPSTIEEAESSEAASSPTPVPSHIQTRDRNRQRTPPAPGSSPSRLPGIIDRSVMSGLEDLTCRAGSEEDGEAVDDEVDLDEAEYTVFLLKQRDERRRRRMTSGSISKRTISESIGSDTDTEDLNHPQMLLDANDVGASARRLRRRLDRHSLQFVDPPPPRIEELEEPDTTDDDMIRDGETLARELPYYTLEYISMEVDSA